MGQSLTSLGRGLGAMCPGRSLFELHILLNIFGWQRIVLFLSPRGAQDHL